MDHVVHKCSKNVLPTSKIKMQLKDGRATYFCPLLLPQVQGLRRPPHRDSRSSLHPRACTGRHVSCAAAQRAARQTAHAHQEGLLPLQSTCTHAGPVVPRLRCQQSSRCSSACGRVHKQVAVQKSCVCHSLYVCVSLHVYVLLPVHLCL